jgi:hypothetical protein
MSDKTDNWPYWYVADAHGLNVTARLIDALHPLLPQPVPWALRFSRLPILSDWEAVKLAMQANARALP